MSATESQSALQARDPKGLWYNAIVTAKQGYGQRAIATVRYVGFAARHNERFSEKHKAVRVRISRAALNKERELTHFGDCDVGKRADGTWEIEHLIGKRRHKKRWEYLVRWAGWSDSPKTEHRTAQRTRAVYLRITGFIVCEL